MPGSLASNLAAYTSYIVAIPVVVIVAFLLIRILRANRATQASAGWQTAPGRILESRIELRETRGSGKIVRTNYPHVAYEYTVGRQRFTGNRIAFGAAVGLGFASWVRPTIAKYPAGAACTVFYNPANPAESVLERRGLANRSLWIALAIVGAVLAAILLPRMFLGGWPR